MYVDVILPLAIDTLFSYELPKEFHKCVCVGGRIFVELGNNKAYSGIVCDIHDSDKKGLKPILGVLDECSVVLPSQMKLWKWISSYYMTPIGIVMRNFFPASMKLESHKDEQEKYVFNRSAGEVVFDYLSLCKKYSEQEKHQILDSLIRAKSQHKTFSTFLSMDQPEVRLDDLLKEGLSRLSIKELIRKEIFCIDSRMERDYTPVIERFMMNDPRLVALTEEQSRVYESVKTSFSSKKPVLLFGASGSGKREISMHLVKDTLLQGADVLYLVPDSAMVIRVVEMLKSHFGDVVVEYHVRQAKKSRFDSYNNMLFSQGGRVVVGSRSAISLPFENLRLVIVEEEHDSAYKQKDTAPRFNAKDTALILARLHKANILLSSATPSIESFYQASIDNYSLVKINNSYRGKFPKITVIDRRSIAIKQKKEQGFTPDTRYFSVLMLDKMKKAIENNKQIILFQNRRGFSSYIECMDCGEVPYCEHCNVSLTYHKHKSALECHYCGYSIPIFTVCPKCNSKNILTHGIGTENVEEKIKEYFPDARIMRIDADTVRSKKSLYDLLEVLHNDNGIDIIVGTQLVSRGFDFPRASLVGVINADNILNFPDFRATEKGFQLLTQMAGRLSGCSDAEVIIQTTHTGKGIIEEVRTQDYENMYNREIFERAKFLYPPFFRLISFTIKHYSKEKADAAAALLASRLKDIFGRRVTGPEEPLINRIKGVNIVNVNLRIERNRSVSGAKKHIYDVIAIVNKDDRFKGVILTIDVDPST